MVSTGEHVREKLKAAGHPCTVAVVVTNSGDLGDIGITDRQTVPVGEFLFQFGIG